MRINARLDSESAEKLAFLRRRTGAKTTDVVKRAIDLYYRQLHRPAAESVEIIRNSGLVGCSDGPEHLASDYKRLLTQAWQAKQNTTASTSS